MNENNILKIVASLIVIIFVLSSAANAIITTNSNNENVLSVNNDPNYYTWEDDFSNAQKIDKSLSEDYIVENGKVKIYGTYPQWTDTSFSRMKKITLSSSSEIEDCAVKLIVEYDSDMKSDYGDLRFKFENQNMWLSYWIEEKDPEPNNPYAIVWIKIPFLPSGTSDIYMFYANPSANDIGDYWSVFDQESWESKYAHDHKVTVKMETEGAWDPDVTYGNGKFLVTWEEGTPVYFQQQIRGRFYDSNGDVAGNRFDITSVESGQYRYENPASAYGNGNFFVAFEHYNAPHDLLSRDIEGAIFSSSGSIKRFNICTSSGNQADPCVAYDSNNNKFLVVWEDARHGTNNYDIYGRFFNTNGNPSGNEFPLVQKSNVQCEPWVCFDNVNNHYMVVWEESTDDPGTGPFDIWYQIFDQSGNAYGSPTRISPAGGTKDYNFPCVEFCELTKRFLITYQEDDISSGDWYGPIYGKILDQNGNIKESFTIASGQFERSNIVPHLSSSFFVVYDSGSDIYGKLVSSDGEVNPYELQLSDSDTEPADWANIASSGNNIFVAWEDLRVNTKTADLPDVYANVWSFNTPSSSDVSYNFGEEKSLILEATVTSVKIDPPNWNSWNEFIVEKSGDITFDIINSDSLNVLKSNVNSGTSIQGIGSSSIRIKGTLYRNNPSSSPELNMWGVSYEGKDEVDPVTNLESIDGNKGLNDWYTSESVVIWLHAKDYPEDTGSGIDKTYYTVNAGSQEIYDTEGGIQLAASQNSNWLGEWDVNFWSVDNQGNVEDRNKDQNKLHIRVDSDKPYVEITEPANEEKVEIPFWVRASATDNAVIDRVEFDLEPFGEREGLPYVDENPPYEWYCDEEVKNKLRTFASEKKEETDPNKEPTGTNLMVRAQVFDESGQSWIHEVWIYIKTNESEDESEDKTFNNRFFSFVKNFEFLEHFLPIFGFLKNFFYFPEDLLIV